MLGSVSIVLFFGSNNKSLGSYREWKLRSNIYTQRGAGTTRYTSTISIEHCLCCAIPVCMFPTFLVHIQSSLPGTHLLWFSGLV
uniref:Uncharacterized protein n=1 Tax=Arundo donax TaxID=35708 RepID=A0A0A9DEQ4_ARUDO